MADPRMTDGRKRVADIAFILALMIYILAGIGITPVHGDEYMQMAMSRDVFYMLNGNWAKLAYTPPVQPDTEQYLRLINGTINKDLIGLVWKLNGHSADSLPGIYMWSMPIDWNQRQGNVPTMDDLLLARWPSAILTALGVIPVFILGWHLRLRSLAYPSALIYALHPVILLNGRRAMMEGSLMLMTLLTMAWVVALIHAEHSANATGLMRRLPPFVRYLGLGILVGLTIAAKHTGIVVAIAALSAVLVSAVAGSASAGKLSWRPVGWIALSAVVGFSVWLALNPGYWNNPIEVIGFSVDARSKLLAQQTTSASQTSNNNTNNNNNNNTIVYKTFGQRLGALVIEPFLSAPQYYESDTWANIVKDQVSAYDATTFDGWNYAPILGTGLTILAAIGLGSLIYDAIHQNKIAWAILIWAGLTALSSLLVPLTWQRYYLPLVLVSIVLAASGLGRLLVRRTPEDKYPEEQPAAVIGDISVS